MSYHAPPSRKGFVAVLKCDDCGTVGDVYYRHEVDPCPRCGSRQFTKLVARYMRANVQTGTKRLWYWPWKKVPVFERRGVWLEASDPHWQAVKE